MDSPTARCNEGTRQASSWVPADRHSGGDLYRQENYRSSERAVGGSFYRPEATEETRERPSSRASGNDLYGDVGTSSLSAIRKLLHNKKRSTDSGNEEGVPPEKKQKS
ncbi:unnamed protein product [Ambrosiozyma monospora]|uniref:Unnamed protein product n=1 Tax=Ambrosiozyma monospora TaxID=43982 RepID=A0A9W6T773_AMBMO|nr:unnamed protein product [Ambrosiozyma monospora]